MSAVIYFDDRTCTTSSAVSVVYVSTDVYKSMQRRRLGCSLFQTSDVPTPFFTAVHAVRCVSWVHGNITSSNNKQIPSRCAFEALFAIMLS